jgi:hypothetical protein
VNVDLLFRDESPAWVQLGPDSLELLRALAPLLQIQAVFHIPQRHFFNCLQLKICPECLEELYQNELYGKDQEEKDA